MYYIFNSDWKYYPKSLDWKLFDLRTLTECSVSNNSYLPLRPFQKCYDAVFKSSDLAFRWECEGMWCRGLPSPPPLPSSNLWFALSGSDKFWFAPHESETMVTLLDQMSWRSGWGELGVGLPYWHWGPSCVSKVLVGVTRSLLSDRVGGLIMYVSDFWLTGLCVTYCFICVQLTLILAIAHMYIFTKFSNPNKPNLVSILDMPKLQFTVKHDIFAWKKFSRLTKKPSKIRKIFSCIKAQNRKGAKFYGSENVIIYSKL